MENRICKIISLILSLGIAFANSCEYAFCMQGDPLQQHKEYFDLIRKEFEDTANDSGNPIYPARWKHEPNYWFWTDDYRTVYVYNIPYLLNDAEGTNNFMRLTAQALTDSAIAATRAGKIAKKLAVSATDEVIKIFKDEYKKELTSKPELISSLAKFLGETNEEIVVNACLGAIGMYWACIAGHVASIALSCSGCLDTLVLAHPIAGLTLSAALDLFCIFTGMSRFEMERTKNYATLLHGVWNILQTDPKSVMNSNVLVTAVDKRNFYAIFRHNALRRDDGAWYSFVRIGNLKCAPLAKDFNGGELVSKYLGIYKRIMTDEHLDLDKLQAFVKFGTAGPGVTLTDNTKPLITEKSEKDTKV